LPLAERTQGQALASLPATPENGRARRPTIQQTTKQHHPNSTRSSTSSVKTTGVSTHSSDEFARSRFRPQRGQDRVLTIGPRKQVETNSGARDAIEPMCSRPTVRPPSRSTGENYSARKPSARNGASHWDRLRPARRHPSPATWSRRSAHIIGRQQRSRLRFERDLMLSIIYVYLSDISWEG
jgi:hypothetical protein